MGANRNGSPGRPVPFRWLILTAIWFLACGPLLILALLGLIFAGTTGALVGAIVGIVVGVISYRMAMQALRRAERR